MYIKSVADLTDHIHGEQVMKSMNRHIYKKKAEFCMWLPSHIMKTAEFMNTFQRTQVLDANAALNRYSPYETRLLMQAIDSQSEEDKKRINERIRVANRMTSRFINKELQRIAEKEKSLLTKIKKVFKRC